MIYLTSANPFRDPIWAQWIQPALATLVDPASSDPLSGSSQRWSLAGFNQIWSLWLQLYVQKVLCSEGSMFRRFYVQKVLCSEGPMFGRFYVQKVLCSEGSMFRRSWFRNICSEGPMFRKYGWLFVRSNWAHDVESTSMTLIQCRKNVV